jgi:hypothetical protein
VINAPQKLPAGADALTAPEIFDALEGAIFAGLAGIGKGEATDRKPALSEMERNLQREYVSHLIFVLLDGQDWYPAAVQTLTRHYVKRVAEKIGGALGAAARLDTATRAHLEECQARLTRALDASYQFGR